MTGRKTITIGLTPQGHGWTPLRLPKKRLVGRHMLVTGRTGSGKTMAEKGVLVDLLVHHPDVHLVYLDCKGHGAQDLLDIYLPAFAEKCRVPLTPEDVITVTPWAGSAVPLNILAPIPGVEQDVQATLTVNLLESLLGESMGARMAPILHHAVLGGMQTGGSLVQVLRVLEDDGYRQAVATAVSDGKLRRYLSDVLPTEPRQSVSALAARIRHLTSTRRLSGMLGAKRCIRGADLIGSRVTILNGGDCPMGFDEPTKWLTSWVFHLVCAAIFARKDVRRPVVLFVDEFDVIANSAGTDMERILQKSRSFGCSLRIATQSLKQLRSTTLVESILTNVSGWLALSPQKAELAHLADLLPAPTGQVVDPRDPSRCLTPQEEERAMLRALRSLKPRHGVFADLAERELHLLRTMTIPEDEIAAAAKSASTAPDFWRGRFGVPLEELEQAEPVAAPKQEGRPAQPRSRRGARMALELPE